ncbi:MAG: primosomal protein N' [Firmicutes bacterium]|nr:primosomal protein N' [Bacillota bacterium]
MKYAEIIVDIATDSTDRFFDYRIPEKLRGEIYPGRRVRVPFGNRRIAGYVWALIDKPNVEKTRDIMAVEDGEVTLSDEFMKMIPWFCQRNYCRMIEVINLLLPPGYERIGAIKESYVRLMPGNANFIDEEFLQKLHRRAPKQESVLRLLLSEKRPLQRQELLRKTGVSSPVIQRLVEKGLVKIEEKHLRFRQTGARGHFVIDEELIVLTDEQQAVLHQIMKAWDARRDMELLVHGVTGSGKTEVYLRAIKECLKRDKNALLLVPEIALTPQMVSYFKNKLPREIALLHSRLPLRERYDQWFKIREGSLRVVLGTRSAVFAPLKNIGLIIIDEEQENSYKQEDSPRYHAREVARWRADYHDALLLLGSATPSIESYWEADNKRIGLLEMKERATPFELPEIEVVDMRQELRAGNRSIFSRSMMKKLERVLFGGEQALLFINRRGFSNFVLCRECGYVMRCPHCSVSLTYHHAKKMMVCHYCSYIAAPPTVCPDCRGNNIRFFGAGTQRVEEEIRKLFPGPEVLRMDRDSTSRKGAYQRIWKDFRAGKAQIMVGTQMVAKGLDFPGVTLVGVVAADTGMHLPDFRAAERTFQLVTQVSGRAGRGDRKGEVVVQTYHPGHHSIVYAREHDYRSFFREEIERRRELSYPPFTELLRFLFVSVSEKKGDDASLYMASLLGNLDRVKAGEEMEMLGPAPAPLFRIKKHFRYQLILKGKNMVQMSAAIKPLISAFRNKWRAQDVRLVVDFNPQSML